MAEYVQFPIFDEDGMDTGKYLKVDTRYFLGTAAGIANRFIDVVDAPNAEEEMEVISKIIHGLAPKPRIHDVSLVREGEGTGSIELVDFSSAYSTEIIGEENWKEDGWKDIPGFPAYEINHRGMVIEKATRTTVSVIKGTRWSSVLLTDEFGVKKRMAVEVLVERMFK